MNPSPERSPFARPQCSAIYGGVWADPAVPLRCERLEHDAKLDGVHLAERPGARTCSVSWI